MIIVCQRKIKKGWHKRWCFWPTAVYDIPNGETKSLVLIGNYYQYTDDEGDWHRWRKRTDRLQVMRVLENRDGAIS